MSNATRRATVNIVVARLTQTAIDAANAELGGTAGRRSADDTARDAALR